MKLTRQKRIALELLGPPLVATTLIFSSAAFLFAWTAVSTWEMPTLGNENAFSILGYILATSYIFGCIPSLAYTAVMEWKFEGGLNPQSWRAVWLATCLLGSFAGIPIMVVLNAFKFHPGIGAFSFFAVLGLVVGLIIGLLIKHWSTEKKPVGQSIP